MLKFIVVVAVLAVSCLAVPNAEDMWEAGRDSAVAASDEISSFIVKNSKVAPDMTQGEIAEKYMNLLSNEVKSMVEKTEADETPEDRRRRWTICCRCRFCRKRCVRCRRRCCCRGWFCRCRFCRRDSNGGNITMNYVDMDEQETGNNALASWGTEAKTALQKITRDFITKEMRPWRFCCRCRKCTRRCRACRPRRRCCCKGSGGCRCRSCRNGLNVFEIATIGESSETGEVDESQVNELMSAADKIIDDITARYK